MVIESEPLMDAVVDASAGLYRRVLGAAWDELHPSVRRFHADGQPVQATGVFQIRHGKNRVARWATWIGGLPAEGEAVAVTLTVMTSPEGETWSRRFANRPMRSVQSRRSNGLLAEGMGPLEIRFRLEVIEGSLIYHPAGAALRLGPLRIPLPRWLAPSVSAWEKPLDDPRCIQVLIEVTSPLLGLLVSYGGVVTLVEDHA